MRCRGRLWPHSVSVRCAHQAPCGSRSTPGISSHPDWSTAILGLQIHRYVQVSGIAAEVWIINYPHKHGYTRTHTDWSTAIQDLQICRYTWVSEEIAEANHHTQIGQQPFQVCRYTGMGIRNNCWGMNHKLLRQTWTTTYIVCVWIINYWQTRTTTYSVCTCVHTHTHRDIDTHIHTENKTHT